jgi:hypothetical protein
MIRELGTAGNFFLTSFGFMTFSAVGQIQTIADASSGIDLIRSGGVLAVLAIASYVLWIERKSLLQTIMQTHKENMEKRDKEIEAVREENRRLMQDNRELQKMLLDLATKRLSD